MPLGGFPYIDDIDGYEDGTWGTRGSFRRSGCVQSASVGNLRVSKVSATEEGIVRASRLTEDAGLTF